MQKAFRSIFLRAELNRLCEMLGLTPGCRLSIMRVSLVFHPEVQAPMSRYNIFDAYCSPGPTSVRTPGAPYDFPDLLREHERFGIHSRICMHAESRDGVPDEGNEQMTRLAGQNRGTGVVWVVLPPSRFHARPVADLMKDARRKGVAAFAMLPRRQLHVLDTWANRELYEPMAEARLPLYLDATQTDWQSLHDVARTHPDLPVVLWNAGYRTDRYLIPIMDRCPNLHVGLAPTFVQSGGIEDFCNRYGPGRLIYGSGWPSQSPGPLISLVTYAGISDQAKDAILSGNIKHILDRVAWNVRGAEAAS